jgi:hypothetical protein
MEIHSKVVMFGCPAAILCPKKVILWMVSPILCSKKVIIQCVYVPNWLFLKVAPSVCSKKVIVSSQIGYSFSYKTVIVVHGD